MNRIKIEFETENAAFENEDLEIARIIEDLSKKARNNNLKDDHIIKDINGNKVGKVVVD